MHNLLSRGLVDSEMASSNLPDRIRQRLARLQTEIDQIISSAEAILTTKLPDPVQFEFVNSAPRDVLTEYERAQSISFISRFDHLPSDYTVEIVEKNGQYYISNMPYLRHALNEFRPLIQNERDSVYYQKLHGVWIAMLKLDDPAKGTTIRVFQRDRQDVTATFIRWLNERNKAITLALRPLDYGYLYNGILQHSDAAYSERFSRDYASGELNYILWKHMHILGFMREMLRAYYFVIRSLTAPRLGPL
jgi:hypothetical protein